MRFGNICDVDASQGLCRVEFDEDGITSAFLPVLSPNTKENKYLAMPAINEQVVCLMDEFCEQGVVLGALYSQVDKPTGFNIGESGAVYATGSKIIHKPDGGLEFGASSGKLSLANAFESLAGIMSDLLDAHIAETHNVTAIGAPTGPPINLATYQAIKVRLDLLLE